MTTRFRSLEAETLRHSAEERARIDFRSVFYIGCNRTKSLFWPLCILIAIRPMGLTDSNAHDDVVPVRHPGQVQRVAERGKSFSCQARIVRGMIIKKVDFAGRSSIRISHFRE